MMKHTHFFAFLIMANLAFFACARGKADTAIVGATPAIDLSSLSASVAATSASFDADDLVENTAFAGTVAIDLTSGTAATDGEAAQSYLESEVALSVGKTTVTVAKSAFGVTVEATGTEPVKYALSGTLAGTLTVKSEAVYALVLNGVSITATAGPALDLESRTKAFIVTAEGSVNALADSAERDKSLKQKGAIYGAGTLVFSGTGSLAVTARYKHGILSDDYIRVAGGAMSVSVSAKNAIQAVNAFIFDDGTLRIAATGDAIGEESKGIKVDGVDDATGDGKGYIYINGGTIDIASVSKGITAAWDIDEDASADYAAGNPDPFIEINSGIVTVTTTGKVIEAGTVAGDPEASCSPEGIEGKARVTVNGGAITVNTADDALNAGDSIVITGGYLYAASTDNDAIDSNGTIGISGGVIVAIGARVPEAAFDCDRNTFAITGGTLVGIAGTTSEPTAAACAQNVVVLGGGTKGSTFALEAQDGTVAFAFAIPVDYETMVVSSPAIATGATYTPVTGGAISGERAFNGLYLGKLACSGGTDGTAFTVESAVTKAGVNLMGPGGPGGPGGPAGNPPAGIPPAGNPPKGTPPSGNPPTGTQPAMN